MLLNSALTCVVTLALAAVVLSLLSHRLAPFSFTKTVLFTIGLASLAGLLTTSLLDLPSASVLLGEAIVVVATIVVAALRPLWNLAGQAFFGAFVASGLTYLAFAASVTLGADLSTTELLASGCLLGLEAAAMVLSGSFTFECCDVTCRRQWSRIVPSPEPSYQPKVSIHIPARNEPPELLIATIKSLETLRYPDFEIVVIDNNTADPAVWRPVERYCRNRDWVRFVHVDDWPGFKAGALNLALRRHTHDDAELIAVVDADYMVAPEWLESTVGYFVDPNLGFLQTPQDYQDSRANAYFTACYDAYSYFFRTAMPSRNNRNSIIFGGTMGIVRKRVLDDLGGWDERCITEDTELSLRVLKAGYSGLYVSQSFGWGLMPPTFAAMKRQMHRWCFGGMQVLRKHLRSLMPWDRDPNNLLSRSQRWDYLLGGLQWMNDLLVLAFSAILGFAALRLWQGEAIGLRPGSGAAVVLPVLFIASGMFRGVWGLRRQANISIGRAVLAFAIWLSLSWTVALAAVRGIVRSEGVFLRTPKWKAGLRMAEALRWTRVETVVALGLWGVALAMATSGRADPVFLALLAWQGAVYACAPLMASLNTASSARGSHEGAPSTDLDALPPLAAEVELVAGVLVEVGPAMAADLSSDVDLPLATVGGALRKLERAGRARRGGTAWLATTPAPRRPRRSWRSGVDMGA